MKVNGNDPTILYDVQENGNGIAAGTFSNIPIRIEIASRIFAGNLSWYLDQGIKLEASLTNADMAAAALRAADALIKAHNETCGGE